MTKHFENVWEDAEKLHRQVSPESTLDAEILNLEKLLIQLKEPTSKDEQFSVFGSLVFHLCAIASNLNINSYTALLSAIQERKISMLETDDD